MLCGWMDTPFIRWVKCECVWDCFMSVNVNGCRYLLYSNHSPGGQRLNRGQANFLRRGEQRAAQTKSGSERPLYKTGKLAYPCRTPPGLNEILNPRSGYDYKCCKVRQRKTWQGRGVANRTGTSRHLSAMILRLNWTQWRNANAVESEALFKFFFHLAGVNGLIAWGSLFW